MLALDILLRWMHIFAAIALFGGSLFIRIAMLPAVAGVPEDVRRELRSAIRRRWAKVVMASVGFLLLSGLVNMVRIATRYEFPGEISTPLYHGLLGTKFLLALPIFYIASRLAGRSAGAERFREKEAFWLNLNLTLAVLVVAIGGVLRYAERVPKDQVSRAPVAMQVAVHR